MNPRTRKTLVYLSLVAAVIYALLNMKQEFDAGAEAPVASEIPQSKGAVKPAAAPIDIAKYDVLEWGRDPFRKEFSAPAEASNPTPPGWILNGILYDETEPSAIIAPKRKILSSEAGMTPNAREGARSARRTALPNTTTS